MVFDEDEPSSEPSDIEDNQNTNAPEETEEAQETEKAQETEESTEESVPTPEPVSKTPYTPEELDYMMASDMEIDTTRLSPEGQATLKQFQRAYTKKFQALAEEKRRLTTEIKPEPTHQSSDPFEQTYGRYKNNPRQVRAEINAKINELDEADPYSEENRRLIRGLQTLKEDLGERYQSDIDRSRKINSIVAETNVEVSKAIPDFEQKAPALTNFGKELGFSVEEMEFMTDPTKTGKMAARFTIALNNAYNKINAGATAEKKIKKPSPPQLQRSGAGQMVDKKDPSKLSQKDFEDWWRKEYGG